MVGIVRRAGGFNQPQTHKGPRRREVFCLGWPAEPNQRALRAVLIHLQTASTQGNFLLYFDIKSFDHFIYPG